MALKLKPWSMAPPGEYDPTHADWVTSALNQLIGQANTPPSIGFPSLVNPTVDPTTTQITSRGSRTSSVVTEIKWSTTNVAGVCSVTFFWDGTNGSQELKIGRDDGTVVGPTNNGSPAIVNGLVANTQYFFYPYWDEAMQTVVFATTPNVAVGTPPIAFTVGNFLAAQQQILRGRIPLGLLLVSTGVTTPAAPGTATGTGGTGGSSSGVSPSRGALL